MSIVPLILFTLMLQALFIPARANETKVPLSWRLRAQTFDQELPALPCQKRLRRSDPKKWISDPKYWAHKQKELQLRRENDIKEDKRRRFRAAAKRLGQMLWRIGVHAFIGYMSLVLSECICDFSTFILLELDRSLVDGIRFLLCLVYLQKSLFLDQKKREPSSSSKIEGCQPAKTIGNDWGEFFIPIFILSPLLLSYMVTMAPLLLNFLSYDEKVELAEGLAELVEAYSESSSYF